MKNTTYYDLMIIVGHGFVREYNSITEDDAIGYVEEFLYNNIDILHNWNREEEFDMNNSTYPFQILCTRKKGRRRVNIVITKGMIMRNLRSITRNSSYKTIVHEVEQLSYNKWLNYKKLFRPELSQIKED